MSIKELNLFYRGFKNFLNRYKIVCLLASFSSSMLFVEFGNKIINKFGNKTVDGWIDKLGLQTDNNTKDYLDYCWDCFWFLIFIGTILYLLYKFFQEYNDIIILSKGKVLESSDIQNLKSVPKLAIIGLSGSGKTTFINTIKHGKPSNERTQGMSGDIIDIKDKEICFIDISGENNVQQFRAISLADFIVFMFDHNSFNTSAKIHKDRIDNTIKLIKDIKNHLTANSYSRKVRTLVLLNKKDLWIKSGDNKNLVFMKEEYNKLHQEIKSVFGECSEIYDYSNIDMVLRDKTLSELLDIIFKGLEV